MEFRIPKEILKNKLKKSDLSKIEQKEYEKLLRNRGRKTALEVYFGLDPKNPKYLKTIKNQAKYIAILLNNDFEWNSSAFSMVKSPTRYGDITPGLKKFRRLLENTFIPDENKMLFIRRLVRNNLRNSMALDQTEIILNNEVNYEIFKDMVPEYRIRHALDDNLNIRGEEGFKEILKAAKQLPSIVYTRTMLNRVLKLNRIDLIFEFMSSNILATSYLYPALPQEYKEKLPPDILHELIKVNARTIRFIPKKNITKKMAEIAVEKSGQSFLYLSENLQTDILLEQAVMNAPSILRDLPQEKHKAHIMLKATLAGKNVKKYVKRR